MHSTSRFFSLLPALTLFFVLAGCAAQTGNRATDIDVRLVAVSNPGNEMVPAPSFLLSKWQQSYNRIGMVRAEQHDTHEHVFIDPTRSIFYYGRYSFATGNGTYINHAYRVHFPKIPFSLFPFHLGAGSNVGVLIVITTDRKKRPLLITTVNTCGCYVVIIPTSYLSPKAYPDNFPQKEQHIFGETIPAGLKMSSPDDGFLITIRPEVHRVMNVQVIPAGSRPPLQTISAAIQPLSSLKALPLSDGRTTSMFYEKWPLQGHVKDAIKPWESLLLSLISLDLYVGMDKEFDSTMQSGNPFYTSLKPWNRRSSDMNDFPRFLRFHGWNL